MRRLIAQWLFPLMAPLARQQIEQLSYRVLELETALKRHGVHDERCALSNTGIFVWNRAQAIRRWHEGDHDAGCTCPLAPAVEPHRRGQDQLGHIG